MKNNFVWRIIKVALMKYKTFNNFLILKSAYNNSYTSLFVKNILGNPMLLDLNDTGISRELLYYGARELDSFQELNKQVKEGMIVADIGANIGYYALIESNLVGNKGLVYAIEPVPNNVTMLRLNVALNNCKNIKVYEKAMGVKNEITNFYLSKKSNWGALINSLEDIREYSGTIKVDVVKFDDFFKGKKKPDFIRMDVEGYEYEIFLGMREFLKSNSVSVFVEVHAELMGPEKTEKFFKLLKDTGFEECRVIKEFTMLHDWLSRFVPKKILYQRERFDTTISEILKNPIKHGDYQLFLKK